MNDSPIATLIHSKSRLVTREQLAEIPAPPPRGKRHRPVMHADLVRALDEAADEHGLRVVREQLAVAKGGTRLFATFEVEPINTTHALAPVSREGQRFALGLRSGNTGDLAIRLAAGLRVLICDNLAIRPTGGRGAGVVMAKRHTTGLRLSAELRDGVARYMHEQVEWVELTDRAKQMPVTDDEARLLIFSAFERGAIANRLFPEVVRNYFAPVQAQQMREWGDEAGLERLIASCEGEDPSAWSDCSDRSRWGVYGAMTRALRGSSAPVLHRSTAQLAFLLRPGRN